MKPYISVIIFITIVAASALSGIGSYKTTEDSIVSDLNQALAQTLEEKNDGWITPDTIQTYRSHLNISQLKNRAYLSYCRRDESSDITCSDTIMLAKSPHSIGIRGYANCSFATIFTLSDQRMSLMLSLSAMIWGAFSICYFRKKHPQLMAGLITYGGLSYAQDNDYFYNSRNERLHLTPMQHQLMRMFLSSATHSLTKSEICNALWPKKDDPSETLYTLIKRLKPTIESNSSLKIEVDRGRAYRLTEIR